MGDQDNLALYDAGDRRMSWPEAFLSCFSSDRDPYSTLNFLSFSHLKRLGYIVRRTSREIELAQSMALSLAQSDRVEDPVVECEPTNQEDFECAAYASSLHAGRAPSTKV